MTHSASRLITASFWTAWRLRWPFALAQLTFAVLSAAILAPAIGFMLTVAIRMSGQPALTDFAIAGYLLSPVGLVALVVAASVLVAAGVLGTAFMMAIATRDCGTGRASFLDGPRTVLPDLPRVIVFSAHFFVRIALLIAPFALAGYLVAERFLTDYDINYYLTYRPPAFWIAAGLIGTLLGVLALVALPLLASWAIALPLMLFEGCSPADSFRQSRTRLKAVRWRVMLALALWFVVASAISALLLGLIAAIASAAVAWVGLQLKLLAAVLLVFFGLYALVNTVVAALTTGALAVLLCELADWPTVNAERLSGTIRLVPRLGGALAAGIILAGTLASFGLSQDEILNVQSDDVVVIAHRGASGARPENTLAAMQKAIDDRADFLELDVQENAEGDVIVVHDSDFMKLAGVDLKVWDATAAQLAKIDIGSWFDLAYADERTPTLHEVLELANGTTKVLIELKYYGRDEALEARVAQVVETTGMTDQIAVMSLDYDAVRKMKTLRPDWSVGLLAATAIGELWKLDADFLGISVGMATRRLIEASHRAGKPVYVWTINEPLTMSRMISLGVDGLITDEPALAREILSQRRELGSLERLVLALSDSIGIDLAARAPRDASP